MTGDDFYNRAFRRCSVTACAQEYVCGDKGVNCSWGQAINVANRYVYVSQPLKDRVLVISKIQMVVVDVSAAPSTVETTTLLLIAGARNTYNVL